MHSKLFAPIIALVLWTFVMWAWLYATRIPAIKSARVKLDPKQTKEAFNAQMPPEARWKAENYNHLLEQPTLFYAVTLTLAMLGADSALNTMLAWSYVTLRIAHSLAGDHKHHLAPLLGIRSLIARAACAGGTRDCARLLG